MSRRDIVVSVKRLEDVTGQSVEKVFAEPNPLPVKLGDTVTWLFEQGLAARRLEIVFEDGGSGPFDALTLKGDRVVRTKDDGRFVYKIMENGAQVPWGNPMEGTENFGGIDVPQPPGG